MRVINDFVGTKYLISFFWKEMAHAVKTGLLLVLKIRIDCLVFKLKTIGLVACQELVPNKAYRIMFVIAG